MSPLQYKIYQFIKQFLTEHGYSPTLLEIAEGVGISPRSKGLVSRYVHALVKSGRLIFDRKGYRNIHLAPATNLQLSVVGEIAAGSPIEPVTKHEVLDLNAIFYEEKTHLLVVRGDLLLHDGILNGDKIICSRQQDATDGALAVVVVDDLPPAIKRVHYPDDKTVVLKTANPASNATTHLKEKVAIQAVVVGVLRLLN
jgi:repressor LexA